MLKCNTCDETKPLERFNRNAKCVGGYQHKCKECINRANRDRYAKNPDIFRDRTLKYLAKTKESRREIRREINKKARLKLKAEVLSHYGAFCHCPKCPETMHLS